MKASKLTARGLAYVVRGVGRKIAKRHRAKQTPHGKQSVKKLMAHGASASSIEMSGDKVNDQKLYLSPIIDLFNGEVVSYNLSRHPNFKQVTDMLEGAFRKLPDKVDDLILHLDQGWQYQMKLYQNLLKAKGITQSMSRKATCLDNAVAENFFGLLKTELFYLEKFSSIDQLEKAIVEYIDYYNNR